ncbi:hypothetical protein ACLBWS_18605 [Brucellaceae bacterium D45D]
MAAGKKQAERLRKQRERQKEYRERLKTARKPTRDDIARVMLHFMIVRMMKSNHHNAREQMIRLVLAALTSQGFSEAASLDALDDLIAKYTKSNWGFRRKVHLLKYDL